ncbi:hapless 2-like isoform X2 [Argiope bruennichi]|uniref:hapless 2-like isoform X2 n=2 Tax=Argiope bruennichi TaxID=94029 RepID=UPI0024946865|nr:hapless 2-like isoform X2 [Argiope bruennichi]
MKMTPEGLEYIYVKEVTESSTGVKVRLLNPIVVRLRQNQIVLAYPFKYLSAVNGKASEIILNHENRKNYTGCDDTSSINPTCGLKFERGRVVPFSEGFCCFCPETPVETKQTRGEQDCSRPAPDLEAQKLKASAHCLHFSDVWYSVSALSDPVIFHDIFLQVYNQRHLINGSAVWVSLTHEEDFELNYKNTSQYDTNKTIVASFFTESPKKGTILISSDENRLLIPQPMPGVELDKLPPAVKNGATDYLLIDKSVINPVGDECDMAGVSYKGFAKQPDRCDVPKGTCLKNQPLDFWESDEVKRKANQKGTHLLQNYGTPYKDPIIIDKDTKDHWLALEYYDEQRTVLTIEFVADQITTLTPGKHIQISQVITASMEKKIKFYVYLSNKDLSPASLFAKAIDCEFEVPDSTNVTNIVPPQRTEEFVLETEPGNIELTETLKCTVVAGSSLYDVVSKREVLVKPLRRCICNMHCLCACMGESLTCEPMEEEDYHAAGFRGSLPILTAKPPYRPWFIAHPFLALLALILFLLLIGLSKGLCGVMGRKNISYYGLEKLIFGKRKIKHYFEPDLKKRGVVYDEEGHPIHPDTKKPVRVFSEEIIFAMNAFFLCLWPYMKFIDWLATRKKGNKGAAATSGKKDATSTDDKSPPRRWFRKKKGTDESAPETSPVQTDNKQHGDKKRRGKKSPEGPQHTPSERSGAADEAKRQGIKSGRSLKNTLSDSALESGQYKSNPDLSVIGKELATWQKGTHKIQAVKK